MIAARWGRTEAVAGAIAAVLLIELTPGLPAWVNYLLLWTVLTSAVVVAFLRERPRYDSDVSNRRVRMRITWMDVLVGAFVGLLLRAVVLFIELVAVGSVTSSSALFTVDHNLLWLASAIVAPAIFAPIVEEVFFRGLVLPAIGVNWIGVVGSAVIFSTVHLVYGFHPLIAVTTFIAGLVFGALAVRTRRIGPSIAAHVVFNASLVAMSEFGGLAPIAGP